MRLIDADALKKKMQGTDRYFQIKHDIDEAPTVVIHSENVIGLIRAEIQTEYDGILWHYNDYDDGRSDALKWVLEIIDKHTGVSE